MWKNKISMCVGKTQAKLRVVRCEFSPSMVSLTAIGIVTTAECMSEC